MTGSVWLLVAPGSAPDNHTRHMRLAMARRIAALRGDRFGGVRVMSSSGIAPARVSAIGLEPIDTPYFVPEDCLDAAQAAAAGIVSADDLFGGVVPQTFVAGKAVAHPLVSDDAARPAGWQPGMRQDVLRLTLPGYAAFSRDDAMQAVRRLIGDGAVRIKRVLGIGGRGQWRIARLEEARSVIDSIAGEEIDTHGLVLERHLESIETYSVGTARIGRHEVCYHGTQRLVRARDGTEVYGGSTLHLHRGPLDALQEVALSEPVRHAVQQACSFDRLVRETYPGAYGSRRNYDVACGHDGNGRRHCGVLEQSWRFGGASPAEILAMEAFAADPVLATLTASTHERHTPGDTPPRGALVYWNDPTEPEGPVLKYAQVHDADTA